MNLAEKINVMRASVMGANDGILSVAGIVIGVAGANTSTHAILLAGLSGMLAGTVSMAMGEYVSVNAQRDAEKNALIQESRRLDNDYQGEVAFIQDKYQATGISADLAAQATAEMLAHDKINVATRERYGFDPKEKTSAVAAAMASMIAFPTGALLPMAAISWLPVTARIIGTVVAVIAALAVTGYTAAALGSANRLRASWRNVVAGILTMAVTYFVGSLFA
ncbi:VIT1/CCC1 transporter family protein [Lacticaseibacillus parakribbianus]|uniref:VIT1/CCC1 transporter family protein n=1 Tax=Lacticaseibacillus parakribbianus TaxID=2970927 RepID=UPI0021CB71D9|nr:VIT family protein [Lacticaseibacillus parakribbianus]